MEKHILDLIYKFKNNDMSRDEERQLEEFIASGKLTLNDFESLNCLSDQITASIHEQPPRSMDAKFYTMLGEVKAKNERRDWLKNWFSSIPLPFQYAIPMVLLISGIAIGMVLTTTSEKSQEYLANNNPLITTVIHGHSTSDRINAVNKAMDSEITIENLASVLFFSLNNDKSENVRIAAIEALLKYADNDIVRKGLIDAIRNQTSPLVIMNLAGALKLIGSDIPIDQYKDMLNKDLPQEAISKIEEGLRII